MNEAGDGLAEVVLAKGQSILISCEEAGTQVLVSGEVSNTDYETTAVEGFNFVGNTTPATIHVQDMQLDFGSGVAGGGDNLQILDEGGAMVHAYLWWPGDWFGSAVDGWMNEAGDGLADFTLAPGQGVLVSCEAAGTVITVPSAIDPQP